MCVGGGGGGVGRVGGGSGKGDVGVVSSYQVQKSNLALREKTG